jgi:hypothetical protein
VSSIRLQADPGFIFDPPLQHFQDIVRNAKLFYEIRGTWPMTGWLDAFEALKLISTEHRTIKILRHPSDEEIAAAKKIPSEFF